MTSGRNIAIITALLAPVVIAACAQSPRQEPVTPLAPDLAGAPPGSAIPGHDTAPDPGAVLFSYPVVEGIVYSRFGAVRGGGRVHSGTDISAPRGTPVRAAGAGRVIYAGYGYQGSAAWGQVVLIDHGRGWTTLYAHLSAVDVSVGQDLLGGEQIGRVGRTGNATGPHLHIEVRENGTRHDPSRLIPGIGTGS
ncbi:murein hydrolase activator EnvC family protein [Maricaulis maris]|uniref:Peptidase M23-like protein n=1 Tax=Maricaulis maris TaxID=74318 RepID=A0A495DDI7_9PROT|nr:M23 family metallopeptidase [Maricaulis maris]RKR00361.1 peptidase M23-like protein [Maricaulis maris]